MSVTSGMGRVRGSLELTGRDGERVRGPLGLTGRDAERVRGPLGLAGREGESQGIPGARWQSV